MHVSIVQEVINQLNTLDDDNRFGVAMDTLATLIATLSRNNDENQRLIMWEAITKAMHLDHKETIH